MSKIVATSFPGSSHNNAKQKTKSRNYVTKGVCMINNTSPFKVSKNNSPTFEERSKVQNVLIQNWKFLFYKKRRSKLVSKGINLEFGANFLVTFRSWIYKFRKKKKIKNIYIFAKNLYTALVIVSTILGILCNK